jgi:hypothetical protein
MCPLLILRSQGEWARSHWPCISKWFPTNNWAINGPLTLRLHTCRNIGLRYFMEVLGVSVEGSKVNITASLYAKNGFQPKAHHMTNWLAFGWGHTCFKSCLVCLVSLQFDLISPDCLVCFFNLVLKLQITVLQGSGLLKILCFYILLSFSWSGYNFWSDLILLFMVTKSVVVAKYLVLFLKSVTVL